MTTTTTTRNSPGRWRTILLAALAVYVGVAVLFVAALSMALAPAGGGAVFGARVAVVELEGTIVDVDALLHDLKAYRENPQVKAVVLRINSPGGVVGPTQELHGAIMRLRESGNRNC